MDAYLFVLVVSQNTKDEIRVDEMVKGLDLHVGQEKVHPWKEVALVHSSCDFAPVRSPEIPVLLDPQYFQYAGYQPDCLDNGHMRSSTCLDLGSIVLPDRQGGDDG